MEMTVVDTKKKKKSRVSVSKWWVFCVYESICVYERHKLYGHPFTWERGRYTNSWLEIRSDRAMAIKSLFDLLPYVKLYNLEDSPSDHSAIFLDPTCRVSGMRKKYFRHKNAWLTEPSCIIIVRNNWESSKQSDIQQKI